MRGQPPPHPPSFVFGTRIVFLSNNSWKNWSFPSDTVTTEGGSSNPISMCLSTTMSPCLAHRLVALSPFKNSGPVLSHYFYQERTRTTGIDSYRSHRRCRYRFFLGTHFILCFETLGLVPGTPSVLVGSPLRTTVVSETSVLLVGWGRTGPREVDIGGELWRHSVK